MQACSSQVRVCESSASIFESSGNVFESSARSNGSMFKPSVSQVRAYSS